MTSDKQRAANHENAKKSTGPKSADGKARTSANAVAHGAYARRLDAISMSLLKEDPVELLAFVEDIITELAPRSVLEEAAARSAAERVVNQARANRLAAVLIDRDAAVSKQTLSAQSARVKIGYANHLLAGVQLLRNNVDFDAQPLALMVHGMTGQKGSILARFDADIEAREPRTPQEWVAVLRQVIVKAYGNLDRAQHAARVLLDENGQAAHEEGRVLEGQEADRIAVTLDRLTAL